MRETRRRTQDAEHKTPNTRFYGCAGAPCYNVGAMSGLRRFAGLARSLALYHGIPFRTRRLVRLYAPFVRAGALAFDIGAHAGGRVRAFRRLGARVVAVEPQPDFVRILHALFGRDPHIVIVSAAVGREPGEARLLVSERTPTVTTLSHAWAQHVAADPSFRGVSWTPGARVPVTTLDALIAAHGRPDFVKIDVEGYEAETLAGLTVPLPALSFEYLAAARDRRARLRGPPRRPRRLRVQLVGRRAAAPRRARLAKARL